MIATTAAAAMLSQMAPEPSRSANPLSHSPKFQSVSDSDSAPNAISASAIPLNTSFGEMMPAASYLVDLSRGLMPRRGSIFP
ncbi:hypothetical protein D3C74_476870 [compost metagenome]